MSKRAFTFGILFMLVVTCFIPITFGFNVRLSTIEQPSISFKKGKTLYVGGSGPDNYTKIQDAIDNASDGDTVYVYDGGSPYKELVVIDKSIDLIGEDRDNVVIDGDYKGSVVDIQTDGVTVSGFTIIECKKQNDYQNNVINIVESENIVIIDNIISIGPEPWFKPWVAGVYLKDSTNNLIQNNIIFDNSGAGRTVGIKFYGGSSFNNVSGNEVYGYTRGISLSSNDNVIYGNNIHHNSDGIDNNGDSNKIINNIVTNNPSEGITNLYASNTLISGNTVTYNGQGIEFDNGIAIVHGSNNHVINNHISNNNPTGIFLLISENNLITDNRISDNKLGVYADFAYKNTISRNNFIGNDRNAYFKSQSFLSYRNTWDKNYWSDSLGLFPKIIPGTVYFLVFLSLPWFQIDWHPAREPYDIEGVI